MSEIALTLSFSKCPTNICTWFIIQACSPLLCAPRTPLKRKWIWKKGEREVNERSLPYDKLQQYKWKRIAGIVSHTRMMIHLEFFFSFFPSWLRFPLLNFGNSSRRTVKNPSSRGQKNNYLPKKGLTLTSGLDGTEPISSWEATSVR